MLLPQICREQQVDIAFFNWGKKKKGVLSNVGALKRCSVWNLGDFCGEPISLPQKTVPNV